MIVLIVIILVAFFFVSIFSFSFVYLFVHTSHQIYIFGYLELCFDSQIILINDTNNASNDDESVKSYCWALGFL